MTNALPGKDDFSELKSELTFKVIFLINNLLIIASLNFII